MLYMDTDLTSGPTTTLTSEHYRMHKHAGYKELPSCSIVDARHRYSCSALHCTAQQQRNAPALQCVRAHWRCLRQHARGDAPALLWTAGTRRGLQRRFGVAVQRRGARPTATRQRCCATRQRCCATRQRCCATARGERYGEADGDAAV